MRFSANKPFSLISIKLSSDTSKSIILGSVESNGGRSGKDNFGQGSFRVPRRSAITARSMSGLWSWFASQSESTFVGTFQKCIPRVVDISTPICSGNNVLNPSNAAWARLSVTPGLNPINMETSGELSNLPFSKNDVSTVTCSSTGSENNSSAARLSEVVSNSPLTR